MNKTIAPAALAVILLSAGCEKRCMESADPDAKYNVTVSDIYNAQRNGAINYPGGLDVDSTGTCAGIDGIASGASIELRATGEADNHVGTCYLVSAQLVSAPPQLTLLGPSSNGPARTQITGSGAFMYSLEDVTVGGCTGVWVLGFFDGGNSGGIFAKAVAGGPPPAILYRLFLPSSGSCSICDDNFVVQLTKE
jgi:hypothetical protein